MAAKNKIEIIVNLLEKFISGSDRSIKIANNIEVALDEAFPNDDDIQEIVTCFACYKPDGGEYLYDKEDMIIKCKELIEILKARYDTPS